MVLNNVVNEVLMPLFRRIGTAAGTWLVTVGASQDQGNAVALGVVALMAVAVDLIGSHVARKVEGDD